MTVETRWIESDIRPLSHHRMSEMAHRQLRRVKHRIRRASVTLRKQRGRVRARVLLVCHDGLTVRCQITHTCPRTAVAEGLRRTRQRLGDAA